MFFSESNLVVLDCEQQILADVLMQAQQVGLISTGYFFLLTSLDAHVVDLENYKYGGTNFTAFRLIDVDKPEVQNVIYGIVESIIDSDLRGANVMVPEGNLDSTTALIYDSVHAFALALNELTSVQQVRQKPLDCSGTVAWAHGNSLVNYMKMVEFIGLSGPIKFDASGLRTQFAMDLMELQMPGLVRNKINENIYEIVTIYRRKSEHGTVSTSSTSLVFLRRALGLVLTIQWQIKHSLSQPSW